MYIIALLLAVMALCGYVLWWVLPDNTGRIDAIRAELDTVRKQQQSAIDRISRVEKGLADSVDRVERTESAVNNATDRITVSQERVTDSAKLISDSKRIISDIKQRGKTGD